MGCGHVIEKMNRETSMIQGNVYCNRKNEGFRKKGVVYITGTGKGVIAKDIRRDQRNFLTTR